MHLNADSGLAPVPPFCVVSVLRKHVSIRVLVSRVRHMPSGLELYVTGLSPFPSQFHAS